MAEAFGNPFHYGTPAQAEHFTGRDEELAALVSRLRNGIHVVLISPRRYGKTSLLLRAEAELQADEAAVIHANVLRCRDLSGLVSALATQAFRVPGGAWHQVAHAAAEFAKRFRLQPQVTIEDGKYKFTFEPRLRESAAEDVVESVYRLLAEASHKRPAALVLDEFQAVAEVAPHLPNLLKGLADEFTRVSLVLAGSKQHLLKALLLTPSAPLYGMAERFALGPLPDDVMADYLLERAEAGGKRMTDEVARLIIRIAGPVPNDIQRLAYEAWDAAVDRIDEVSVDAGMRHAVAHEAATYADRFEALALGQRRLIAAIAEEPPSQPMSAEFVARTGLANASSVRRALDSLEAGELVAKRHGVTVVSDPFFAAWLRESP